VLGTNIGNYAVTAELGEGGMGSVYLAEHAMLGRRAAVKVVRPELSTNTEIIARFFNEARALNAIRHPGIVEIFDFGYLSDGSAYIVMEYLEGESLGARCRRLHRLEPRHALLVVRQIGLALAAAHERDVIHRDLKPDNIFLVPDPETPYQERIKVLDFGIAKLAAGGDRAHTQTGSVLGTPTYMSPEQCRGAGGVDARADLYALGCMLYEMLCGHPPFTVEGMGELIAHHMYFAPTPPRSLDAAIPESTERLVLWLLQKEPAARPQTAREVVDTIDRLVGSGPAHAALHPQTTPGVLPPAVRASAPMPVATSPTPSPSPVVPAPSRPVTRPLGARAVTSLGTGPTTSPSVPTTPAPMTGAPSGPPTPTPLPAAPVTPPPMTPASSTTAPAAPASSGRETPTSVTPPPEPAQMTSAPLTSASVTSASMGPATPVPASMGPATPVPASMGPATPVRASMGPATPVPASMEPATPSSMGPATPVPASMGPATPVPASMGPATPAPMGSAPPAPVSSSPVPVAPKTLTTLSGAAGLSRVEVPAWRPDGRRRWIAPVVAGSLIAIGGVVVMMSGTPERERGRAAAPIAAPAASPPPVTTLAVPTAAPSSPDPSPVAGSAYAPSPTAPLATESPPASPAPVAKLAIAIDSVPRGATVIVDGQTVGTTPFAESIEPSTGQRVYTLQRRGYEPATVTLAGDRAATERVKLKRRGRSADGVGDKGVNPFD
jgi:serine/threonine protein kinase